jgi:hypothetical protein
VVASLAISVQGKPVGTSATIAPTSVTLMQGTGQTADVTVNVLDQYSEAIAVNSGVTVKLLSSPQNATSEAKSTTGINAAINESNINKGKVVVTVDSADYTGTNDTENSNNQGTYVYSVTLTTGSGAYKKELVRTFSVVVVKNDVLNPNYQLSVGQSSVDTTVDAINGIASEATTAFDIKIQKAKNGAVIGDLNPAYVAYTIKHNGTTVLDDVLTADTTSGATAVAHVVTSGAITSLNNSLSVLPVTTVSTGASSAYSKQLEKGTYYVTATTYVLNTTTNKYEKVVVTNSFEIADSQDTDVTVDFDKTSGVGTLANAFDTTVASPNISISYDGVDVTSQCTVDMSTIDYTIANNAIYVKSVYISVPVGNYNVLIKTTINKYFVL